jgi:hypothetical protein
MLPRNASRLLSISDSCYFDLPILGPVDWSVKGALVVHLNESTMSLASGTIDIIDDSTRPVTLSCSMIPTMTTPSKPQSIDHHKFVSCPPSKVVSSSRPDIASKALPRITSAHGAFPRDRGAESGNCPVLFDEVHECGSVVAVIG